MGCRGRRILVLLTTIAVFLSCPPDVVRAQSAEAPELLVSSRFTNRIIRYDGGSGALRGMFASGGLLANPNGIAFGPDGNLYAGLGDEGRILRYDRNGAFIDVFVSTGGLSACRALVFGPDGDLYVADGPNDRILRYDGRTGAARGVAASGGGMSGPVGLTFGPDGNIYVGAALSNGVYVYEKESGAFLRKCGCPGHTGITGVLFGDDGLLYAAAPNQNAVFRFRADTCECLGIFASGGGLRIPIGLTWAPDGDLLVGSFLTDSVLKYNGATGAFLGVFISPGSGGLDGTHNFAFVPPPPPDPVSHPRRRAVRK